MEALTAVLRAAVVTFWGRCSQGVGPRTALGRSSIRQHGRIDQQEGALDYPLLELHFGAGGAIEADIDLSGTIARCCVLQQAVPPRRGYRVDACLATGAIDGAGDLLRAGTENTGWVGCRVPPMLTAPCRLRHRAAGPRQRRRSSRSSRSHYRKRRRPRNAPVVRQHRLNDHPFLIRQFIPLPRHQDSTRVEGQQSAQRQLLKPI